MEGDSLQVRELSPDAFWSAAPKERLRLFGAARTVARLNEAEVHYLPAVPRPPKLICVAANYADHIREGGNETALASVRPQLFLKPQTTLSAHREVVLLPPTIQSFDWEAELAVVIGQPLWRPSAAETMAGVIGYAACNDLSERALKVDATPDERKNTWFFDWLAGKWINGGLPLGPWLVTSDEIGDPQALHIELKHNGKVMQDAPTAAMLSPVEKIVWTAAQIMRLEPGDVIATGTPAGVGSASGLAIRPGDVIDVSISKIGTLTTRFAAE
ncbi:MAG TPA: fumarylacetoacetate hydrolase family protein [Limnochordia bacterium]|nr:fumarylacetoacetate hydrolase family protein [Limnochordia bacterium]